MAPSISSNYHSVQVTKLIKKSFLSVFPLMIMLRKKVNKIIKAHELNMKLMKFPQVIVIELLTDFCNLYENLVLKRELNDIYQK